MGIGWVGGRTPEVEDKALVSGLASLFAASTRTIQGSFRMIQWKGHHHRQVMDGLLWFVDKILMETNIYIYSIYVT